MAEDGVGKEVEVDSGEKAAEETIIEIYVFMLDIHIYVYIDYTEPSHKLAEECQKQLISR